VQSGRDSVQAFDGSCERLIDIILGRLMTEFVGDRRRSQSLASKVLNVDSKRLAARTSILPVLPGCDVAVGDSGTSSFHQISAA
jgi:hypothetical protein